MGRKAQAACPAFAARFGSRIGDDAERRIVRELIVRSESMARLWSAESCQRCLRRSRSPSSPGRGSFRSDAVCHGVRYERTNAFGQSRVFAKRVRSAVRTRRGPSRRAMRSSARINPPDDARPQREQMENQRRDDRPGCLASRDAAAPHPGGILTPQRDLPQAPVKRAADRPSQR